MSIDKKILSEIERYKNINRYILEQEATAGVDDLGALTPPPGGTVPPPPPGQPAPPPPAGGTATPPEPIDVDTDDEVTKIDDEGDSEEKENDTEELDITDLVDSQKNMEEKQDQYFNNLFSQVQNLESKLREMDNILNKLNSIEVKIEKYREKTPQEKLELRTYDSYPFNQKLSDFFDDKKIDMEKTGKNDYILTKGDIEDANLADIKKSFLPGNFESDY